MFQLETGKLGETYAIPMVLHCPQCGERHIDEEAFAEVAHHTHACQGCGFVWRPAKVNTHGVRFLPGYSNALNNESKPVEKPCSWCAGKLAPGELCACNTRTGSENPHG